MQSILQRASMLCFGAVSAFLIWFGFVYATAPNLLPFHAAAVPPEALEAVRPIYFALMKLVGSASAALGLLGAYTLFGPIVWGVRGAALAMTLTYLLAFGVAGYTAVLLNAQTGAPVAWYNMAVLSAITVLGLLLHSVAKRHSIS